jgi:hypothetical protein
MHALSTAGVVYDMGLVSDSTRSEISERTEEVVQLISQNSWEAVSSACVCVERVGLFVRLGTQDVVTSSQHQCCTESAAHAQQYTHGTHLTTARVPCCWHSTA